MQSSDAIAVLGGSLVKEKSGRWRTTGFEEGDNFGVQGDRLRVIAAGLLYKKDGVLIIALGGRGQLKDVPDSPAVSEVIKDELIELGVRPEDIFCEKNSGSTFEQLRELGDIAGKENLEALTIITNEYHLPRVRAMVQYNPVLTKAFSHCRLVFKSAESVLLEYDSETWKEVISAAYKSDAVKKRIASEMAGAEQIKDGTYVYRN